MRQLVQHFLDWSLLVLRTGLLLFSADPKLEAMLGMEAAVKSCRGEMRSQREEKRHNRECTFPKSKMYAVCWWSRFWNIAICAMRYLLEGTQIWAENSFILCSYVTHYVTMFSAIVWCFPLVQSITDIQEKKSIFYSALEFQISRLRVLTRRRQWLYFSIIFHQEFGEVPKAE